MQLGWIDFSKEDRKKVLSVIDLLSEDGTLDELGIAPIRDGFADLFFPGTSTIQTRAKYFLIVPYALDSLSRQADMSGDKMLRKLDDIERQCAKILVDENADGAIGRRTILSGGWVKRPPSAIYWAGIRRYGIFTQGKMSLTEYAKISGIMKKSKQDIKKMGSRNDDADEHSSDDADAGALFSTTFWNWSPSLLGRTNDLSWIDSLTMKLDPDEAMFLKSQIEFTQKDSLFAYILENNLSNIAEMDSFIDFCDSNIIRTFPAQLQNDVLMAYEFSRFIAGVFARYNIVVSNGKNKDANKIWEMYQRNIPENTSLDIDAIRNRLRINNPGLIQFIKTIRKHLISGDTSALDECIRKREEHLKGPARAKMNHPRESDDDKWVGNVWLEYRFGNAMTIARDIFDGLEAV